MAGTHPYTETKSLLQGQFSPPYSVIDFDQIEPQLEQGADPFLVIEEIDETENLIAFGDPDNLCHREQGVLGVHAFVRSPQSSSTARTLADQIRDFLRHRRYADVRITDVTPPQLGLMNDGLWTSATVSAFYDWDFPAALPAAIP